MPKSSTTAPAKPVRHGVLALVCTGLELPLQVLHSAAGYYIGTERRRTDIAGVRRVFPFPCSSPACPGHQRLDAT